MGPEGCSFAIAFDDLHLFGSWRCSRTSRAPTAFQISPAKAKKTETVWPFTFWCQVSCGYTCCRFMVFKKVFLLPSKIRKRVRIRFVFLTLLSCLSLFSSPTLSRLTKKAPGNPSFLTLLLLKLPAATALRATEWSRKPSLASFDGVQNILRKGEAHPCGIVEIRSTNEYDQF